AGVVALFWLGRTGSVTPGIGLQPLIVAFVATVLGGMNSLVGAVVGGYALAFITVMIHTFLPAGYPAYRQAFTFSLVIVILTLRPEGLVRRRGEGCCKIPRRPRGSASRPSSRAQACS